MTMSRRIMDQGVFSDHASESVSPVGCGRIGSWMGRYAGAGMVVGYDPMWNRFQNISVRAAARAAETSDFISIYVHLSAETRRLISRELFRRMKKGRPDQYIAGAVIDESALLESSSRAVAAAAWMFWKANRT